MRLQADGVLTEVFKHSKEARKALFVIVSQIWREEKVPVAFAEDNFKMIFKKGDPNDSSKYSRCAYRSPQAYLQGALVHHD